MTDTLLLLNDYMLKVFVFTDTKDHKNVEGLMHRLFDVTYILFRCVQKSLQVMKIIFPLYENIKVLLISLIILKQQVQETKSSETLKM